MTQPIRTPYHVATDYGDKPLIEWTLREALEYYKKGIKLVQDMPPAPLEARLMDESWVGICAVLAEREGIIVGPLSYFLGELALTEMRLQDVAEEELEHAKAYPRTGDDPESYQRGL